MALRFVLIGAGGVGGYIGVRLAEAGHDVAWLVRGAAVAALRERGIVLTAPQGEVRLPPQCADDDAAALAGAFGRADAVIVTTKLYDLPMLAPKLAPLAGPDTMVVPLQNGVDAYGLLAAALPACRPLKGVVTVKASRLAPGRIEAKSEFCRVRFGEAGGGTSPRAEALAAAMRRGIGLEATIPASIDLEIWSKFVMLASYSAIACLARVTIGQVSASAEASSLVIAAAEEAVAVGRAEGIALPADVVTTSFDVARRMPAQGKPSMLEDLEAGRPLELDYFSGTIVRLGRKHGIATPVHAMAYAALAMHRGGKPRG